MQKVGKLFQSAPNIHKSWLALKVMHDYVVRTKGHRRRAGGDTNTSRVCRSTSRPRGHPSLAVRLMVVVLRLCKRGGVSVMSGRCVANRTWAVGVTATRLARRRRGDGRRARCRASDNIEERVRRGAGAPEARSLQTERY